MKKIVLGVILGALLVGCSTAPITGRHQLSLVSNDTILAQSATEYDQVIKGSTVLNNSDAALVKKVGGKISKAVEEFLRSKPEYADMVDDYNWEFNLIKSDQVNAWCMPGGKVAFYTGILPITQGEQGIAVVMGHEIAHAVAEHGRERMSQELVKSYGSQAISKGLGATGTLGATSQTAISSLYGYGSNLVTLKYGRDQETEADKLGLIFMTMAGYDPNEAVKLWERMAAQGGSGGPEFLSTHPSDEKRIATIKEYINSEEFKKYTGR